MENYALNKNQLLALLKKDGLFPLTGMNDGFLMDVDDLEAGAAGTIVGWQEMVKTLAAPITVVRVIHHLDRDNKGAEIYFYVSEDDIVEVKTTDSETYTLKTITDAETMLRDVAKLLPLEVYPDAVDLKATVAHEDLTEITAFVDSHEFNPIVQIFEAGGMDQMTAQMLLDAVNSPAWYGSIDFLYIIDNEVKTTRRAVILQGTQGFAWIAWPIQPDSESFIVETATETAVNNIIDEFWLLAG
ncbi:MAG: hypothetical protein KDE48_08500 [Anaerolineales bacterium]|nr:hypothetical protein [Anaerolineales bacterium]